jgi:hypothetical protein
VAGAVLNHRRPATPGGAQGAYQRANRWPEVVLAMEHCGRLLNASLKLNRSEVVPMAARTG